MNVTIRLKFTDPAELDEPDFRKVLLDLTEDLTTAIIEGSNDAGGLTGPLRGYVKNIGECNCEWNY